MKRSFNIFLLALASQNVLPALQTHLWMLKILTTERGVYFAFLVFFIALYNRKEFLLVGMNVVTIFLFILPILSAKDEINFINLMTFNFEKYPSTVETFTYNSEGLKFDFLKSQNPSGLSPILISIHGGSWQGGDRKDLQPYDALYSEAGFHVAKLSYHFAPKHAFPKAVEDVCQLIEKLQSNAINLQIDMTKIVLLGRSAGGQIALSVPHYCHFKIAAIISHYSPTNLIWGYENSKSWQIIDGHKVISAYVGKAFGIDLEPYKSASPALRVNEKFPPTFIVHGENDELVSIKHAHFLHDALQKNGVTSELFVLPWATHGFDYFWNGPSSQAAFSRSIIFLKKFIALHPS